MREVLVINPVKKRKRRKATAKKKATVKRKTSVRRAPAKKRATAKRKTSVRRAPAKRSLGAAPMARKRKRVVKRRRRSNPAPSRRRSVRRVARAASKSFMGLNFKAAFKDVLPTQMGMFAAKFAAKRFGEPASETDPESWNYMSYIKGALGGVAAGMLANSIKPGTGQKVLTGAVNLMVYKAFQNEFIANNDTLGPWLGADDDDDDPYVPDEYLLTGSDDDPYMFSDDGDLMPAADQHRFLPEVSMGDSLEVPGRLGGYGDDSVMQPIDRLGQDPFTAAYNL